MSQASSVNRQELKDNIRTILEFYKELGFERLPLNYSNELRVTSNDKDSSEPIVMSDKLIRKKIYP